MNPAAAGSLRPPHATRLEPRPSDGALDEGFERRVEHPLEQAFLQQAHQRAGAEDADELVDRKQHGQQDGGSRSLAAGWDEGDSNRSELRIRTYASHAGGTDGNRCAVRLHTSTSISITGTSISTPTTVASAAPEESPNSITAVAIATSK